MAETVGVIGLGAMGRPAAIRLSRAGAAVRGYDPAAAARDALANEVSVCPRAREAVSGASVALLSVPGPGEVLDTMNDIADVLRDVVVVDISTIDPGTARAAAALAHQHGGVYVDAPVLGRPHACGQWTLAVGGPEAAVERVSPLLKASIARTVARVGDVGAGSSVKIMNNLMFGAINTVTAEVLAMGESLGIAPSLFASLVADSGAATVSNLFRELAPKIAADDFSPTFSLRLLHKDNRLALELARQAGNPGFVARCVDHVNTLAMYQGLSDQDSSAVTLLYRMLTDQRG